MSLDLHRNTGRWIDRIAGRREQYQRHWRFVHMYGRERPASDLVRGLCDGIPAQSGRVHQRKAGEVVCSARRSSSGCRRPEDGEQRWILWFALQHPRIPEYAGSLRCRCVLCRRHQLFLVCPAFLHEHNRGNQDDSVRIHLHLQRQGQFG